MVGIEALLGDGQPGQTARIRRRASDILGAGSALSRRFAKMYAMRSAVIHGSIGFMPHDSPFEVPKDYAKDHQAISDACDASCAVLIALIQRFVSRDASDLSFAEVAEWKQEAFDPNKSGDVERFMEDSLKRFRNLVRGAGSI
jgi:hypothetical protein